MTITKAEELKSFFSCAWIVYWFNLWISLPNSVGQIFILMALRVYVCSCDENLEQKTWCCHISPPLILLLLTRHNTRVLPTKADFKFRHNYTRNLFSLFCLIILLWALPTRRDASDVWQGRAAHHFWAAFLTPFLSTSKLGLFCVVFIAQREIPCHHCPYKKKETGWWRQS